ncbi:MAG: hypothetical protein ABSC11_05395 [Smithella sp.]|jgi:hypothetical protein
MIVLSITKSEKPKNKNLIFVSAGDRETFASFASRNLTGNFDLAFFYYGKNQEKANNLRQSATVFASGTGTKFNSIRQMHKEMPDLIKSYETVWVCDDDPVPVKGNINDAPDILKKFHLKVLSPAHAQEGKISHQIMLPLPGVHVFRYVNFVEMSWPLFSSESLADFLNIYDGSLDGWGTDWWFMNYFDANHQMVAGIMDKVVFLNPRDSQKEDGYSEIDLYTNTHDMMAQWNEIKNKNNLTDWRHENLSGILSTKEEINKKWGRLYINGISLIYKKFINRNYTL